MLAGFLALIICAPTQAIELKGFKAYPDLGITQDELKEVLRFTLSQRGASVDDIARTLTLFYRDKGLSFHQVVVQRGSLVLIEGVVTNIVVQDPAWNGLINKAIEDLKGKVVFEPRIQSSLIKLNRWPGIELFSFYSVADSYGGVNLNVIVKAAKKVDLYTSVDNHGLGLSGKNRASFSATAYNLLVKPTSLTISGHVGDVANNYSVSSNLVQYRSLDQLWKFNLSYQSIGLDQEGQNLGLTGSNLSAKYSSQWNLQPTALKSNSKQIWVRYSQSELKSAIEIDSLDSSSKYLQFGAIYSISGLTSKNKSQFNLDTQGVVGWTIAQTTQSPSELISSKMRFNFVFRQDILKGLYKGQDISLGLAGQFGTYNMHSSERFGLTGQTGLTQWEPSKASTEQALKLDTKLFLLQGNTDTVTYNLLINTQAGLGYSKPSETSEFLIKLAGTSLQTNVTYKDFTLKTSYEQPLYSSQEGWELTGNVLFKVGYEKQF